MKQIWYKYDIKSFKKGLKKSIRCEVSERNHFEQLCNKAREIERINKEHEEMFETPKKSIMFAKKLENEAKVIKCQICQDIDYEALYCRKAACVYCKEQGHCSNLCTNVVQKINLVCTWCSQLGHSISGFRLQNQSGISCQYCQLKDHQAGQCPVIIEYEKCWTCKEIGHIPALCTKKKKKKKICDYCDVRGHLISECNEVVCKFSSGKSE